LKLFLLLYTFALKKRYKRGHIASVLFLILQKDGKKMGVVVPEQKFRDFFGKITSLFGFNYI